MIIHDRTPIQIEEMSVIVTENGFLEDYSPAKLHHTTLVTFLLKPCTLLFILLNSKGCI